MWLPFVLVAVGGFVVLVLLEDYIPEPVLYIYAGVVFVAGLYILFTRDSSKDPSI